MQFCSCFFQYVNSSDVGYFLIVVYACATWSLTLRKNGCWTVELGGKKCKRLEETEYRRFYIVDRAPCYDSW
jgi:hypothetical protein